MTRTPHHHPLRRFGSAFSWILIAALLPGCATNPATGKKQLALISESEEIAMGRQADQEIVASLGLYPDEDLQKYVSDIGLALAAESERPDLPWAFRVVDDPIVNAFALPGGFIYVTRGILGHLESEAELATVLGHEIGHVTARHGVNRLSKAQLFNLGLVAGMIAKPGLQEVGGLLQQGMGLLFLKYSRDDERQADSLGLRYAVAEEYDPRRAPDVFRVLERVAERSGSGRIPNWLATHPDPAERQENLRAEIEAMQADWSGSRVAHDPYLAKLDGMIFGPNPREGYFKDDRFYHPELRFVMEVPSGWKTQNTRQAVVAVSEEQDAIVQLTLASEADPAQAVAAVVDKEGIQSGRIERGKIHGFDAATAGFEVAGEQQTIRGRIAAIRDGDTTYQLMGYTLKERWGHYQPTLDGTIASFQRLTDRDALDVQPARLEVVRPPRSMSLEEFQRRYPSTVDLEVLALINQVEAGGEIPGGKSAKRVVGGRLP